MGYDFKAGWVLRKIHSRHTGYLDYEMSGRKQQYYSAIIGFVVALALVALLWRSYFEDGLLPPVAISRRHHHRRASAACPRTGSVALR
ncbi:hypothetical protein [Georgenia sp. SUBG003]|uniref:hypothetical protein n=1 Tax=Georgenia sp. SUBG003 TaxID=1497974 RepID=UPI003AB89BCD